MASLQQSLFIAEGCAARWSRIRVSRRASCFPHW